MLIFNYDPTHKFHRFNLVSQIKIIIFNLNPDILMILIKAVKSYYYVILLGPSN